jgi:hypothetical protein
VRDAHVRADFGQWSRRSEHSTMLGGRRLDAKPVQECALGRV